VACPSFGLLPELMLKNEVSQREWRAGRSPDLHSIGETRELARIVRTVRPDVVHLHGSKAGLAGRLAIRGKTPTIFQPHLWAFQSQTGVTVRPARAWERFAARWTDRFVCVSDDEYRDGRKAGIAGRFERIYNGVDIDEIRPREKSDARARLGLDDAPIAVCVGRLAPLKGQDMLLAAWRNVLQKVPEARLVLVGDGPSRTQLLRDYDWDPSVCWIGASRTPTDYMAAADVVVVPSRAEGMALVPLEAMASGRSVVAFDAGGIRQCIGDGGVVLSVGDVSGLSREVARRLLDPGLAAEEGARGRVLAETHFNVRQSSAAIADLVSQLAGAEI